MIGRLTWFELKKTISGKFFRIALCLMLLLNLLLNCGVREWYDLKEAMRDGTLLEDAVGDESKHDFFRCFAEVRGITRTLKEEGDALQRLTAEQREKLEAALKEKYGEDILDGDYLIPTDEMQVSPGSLEGSNLNDLSLISLFRTTGSHNRNVEEGRQRVLNSAKRLGQDAVKNGDSYQIRRNLRILTLYAKPRQACTTTYIRGWQELLFATPTMILVYLLVLLACAWSFSGEKDSQALLLLHTAKNGQTKTLLAKYLSGAGTAALLTVLFQAVTYGGLTFRLGFLGWNEPVTLLEGFEFCPFRLTIGQYALLTMLGWVLSAVILSMILNTVSALSKNSVISYGVGAVVLGGSIALAYIQPRIEWFSGPLAFTWNNRFFASYYSANLFTYPLWWGLTLALFWGILGILCMVLADRAFCRKRRAL